VSPKPRQRSSNGLQGLTRASILSHRQATTFYAANSFYPSGPQDGAQIAIPESKLGTEAIRVSALSSRSMSPPSWAC
jgi:hypothetical protein